jgi:hypothetical protein
MAVAERERTEHEQLEALWEAPAYQRPDPAGVRALPYPSSRVLVRALRWGWIAFVVTVFAFEPSTNSSAHVPLWGEILVAGFWLSLVAAALAGLRAPRMGLALSALAAGLGVEVAFACRATQHHTGAFWMVELGASAALLVLSAAALKAVRRD